MLNSNYIQSLFGIKDGIIKNIENDDDGSIIHVHFGSVKNFSHI
jgi:hypothetical protein